MTFSILRKKILDDFKTKQKFKVSKGERYIIDGEEKFSKWFDYNVFNPGWKLRQILYDEIVIEFDTPEDWDKDLKKFRQTISLPAIEETKQNLLKDNIAFEIWDHQGKSPHLQIHNLPILHLTKDQRKLFKQSFIKHYVPEKYLPYVDYSLCGVHLLAIEWAVHFKKIYDVKKLIYKSEYPNE